MVYGEAGMTCDAVGRRLSAAKIWVVFEVETDGAADQKRAGAVVELGEHDELLEVAVGDPDGDAFHVPMITLLRMTAWVRVLM